jgi:hypothetical protein
MGLVVSVSSDYRAWRAVKITAKFSVLMSVVFAAICFSVAIAGFSSLGDIVDPVQQADAKGFAWFWAFLGMVSVAFGGLGIWLIRTHKGE